ncbi:MAG TPA: hypothetical protein VN026_03860 [Bacteroidia bacterium]|jgi:hypothetical protein|nr:hypothetical protein [Bacteroidia bacterium]
MKNILIAFLFVLGISINAQTVYITNTGEKYHASGCRYLSKSKNAIELSDALNKGYVACKVCKPTQTVKAESKQKEVKTESSNKNAVSSQCTATTKVGNQCKRMTKSANGKCWQHGGG